MIIANSSAVIILCPEGEHVDNGRMEDHPTRGTTPTVMCRTAPGKMGREHNEQILGQVSMEEERA